jgi:uncharacterized protein
MEDVLTSQEKSLLLRLARQALEAGVRGEKLPALNPDELSERLRHPGTSFVTLTYQGMLRGCIGALQPRQSLVDDVREHAVAAALEDYRFPPVQLQELPGIAIEISRLTLPQDLAYETPEDLMQRLCPHIDGVILISGWRRATFLPQVWEKLPNPETFLNHLCDKMGAPTDLWRRQKLTVQTYQVEEFHE